MILCPMIRRKFLLSVASAACVAPFFEAQGKLSGRAEDIDFAVFRNGSRIGHHRIDGRRDGADVVVDIDILLEVGVGPLVLYRYRHRNREIWRDGSFFSFQSETDDDGTAYRVSAARVGSVIRVARDHDADYETDDLTLLPTTYWNEATVRRDRLLDTQDGKLVTVSVERGHWQRLDTASGPVEARRYDIVGDLTMSLWYDRGGRWTKLAFPFKGDDFEYRLA